MPRKMNSVGDVILQLLGAFNDSYLSFSMSILL